MENKVNTSCTTSNSKCKRNDSKADTDSDWVSDESEKISKLTSVPMLPAESSFELDPPFQY